MHHLKDHLYAGLRQSAISRFVFFHLFNSFYIVPKITGELMAALSLRTVFGEGFYPMYSVSSSAVNAIGTPCSSIPMMNLPEGMSVKMMIAFPSLL